jgi:ABC-2 type transport system ATP-binding protein
MAKAASQAPSSARVLRLAEIDPPAISDGDRDTREPSPASPTETKGTPMNASPTPSNSRTTKLAVIEARDLHCSYGKFEAVRGVDIAVSQGEVYALLGTNGAGKTTTLETLEGHRRPTLGSVSVLGGEPRSVAVRHRVGMMLQESGFAGDLTPRETLELWARIADRRDNSDALLARLDLAGRRDVRVAQLSGGERRRLDLAMALFGRPELLFLDEPTTGLDPESRALVWELIRELLADGVTVMLTTHYLEEAQAIADRIAIMHHGRIAVEGSLAELLASYPARIEFDLPDGVITSDLPPTLDATSIHGDRLRIETNDVERDLEILLTWARLRHLRLGKLSTSEPTLDELFQSVAKGAAHEVAA